MENKQLWSQLYEFNKTQLREQLAELAITRTKTLTKYQMIVKLYGILK